MSENEEIEADEDSERKIANIKQKASHLDQERAGNHSVTQKMDFLIAFQRLDLVTIKTLPAMYSVKRLYSSVLNVSCYGSLNSIKARVFFGRNIEI